MSSNELIPKGTNLPANLDPELQAKILADMEDASRETAEATEFKPPIIKIGKASWLIGEDEEPIQSFNAVVFHLVKSNAYWHNEDMVKNPVLLDTLPENYALGGKIPLCSSVGAIFGSRDAMTASSDGKVVSCFGNCGSGKTDVKSYNSKTGDCYLNCFGTSVSDSGQRGKGKACKNMRRLLLLIEGRKYPHILSLPPTSIGHFDAFCRFVEGRGQSLAYVMTPFALEKISDGQMTWYVFSREKAMSGVKPLSPELYQQVYALRQEHKALLGRVEVTEEEYKVVEAEEVNDPDSSF